jgi:hypothetical protein
VRAGSVLVAVIAFVMASTPISAQEVDDPTIVGPSTTVPLAPADTQPAALAPPSLNGRIVIAGRCPVPLGIDDNACPDRPFPTTVLIRTSDGQHQVASLATADDGTFSIALPPGRYHVDPLLSDGNPPLSSVVVDVPGNQIVPLTIRVSGGSAVQVP